MKKNPLVLPPLPEALGWLILILLALLLGKQALIALGWL